MVSVTDSMAVVSVSMMIIQVQIMQKCIYEKFSCQHELAMTVAVNHILILLFLKIELGNCLGRKLCKKKFQLKKLLGYFSTIINQNSAVHHELNK